MIATYHNHSKWSDGQSDFAELYRHAEEIDVNILGLSDHFCIYPDGTSAEWGLDPNKMNDYLNEVNSYRDKGSLQVCVGLEFGLLDGMSG